MRQPRLAITLGDPRGIGPEVVAKALANPEVRAACDPVIVGARGAGHRRGRVGRLVGVVRR